MNELVSIVTPSYNAGRIIGQTIESVIAQTYKDWELLIIDDCSNDDTEEIILQYSRQDSRIKLFKTNKPSGSPSLPRNIGIDQAAGTYIAFLDADDLWLPEKLEKQIAFMKENQYHISYSYYEKMDWFGNRNNRIIQTRQYTNYSNLLKSNSIPCLTSILSKDAIGTTRFKQIQQEDFCFWLDILKKGFTAYNLCDVTALYRETKSSRSANKISMFKGYWNVIKNHQNISFLKACFCMITYTIAGIKKYIK